MITIVQPRALVISAAALVPNPAATIPLVLSKCAFVVAAVLVPITSESVLPSLRPVAGVHLAHVAVLCNFTEDAVTVSLVVIPVAFVYPTVTAKERFLTKWRMKYRQLGCI